MTTDEPPDQFGAGIIDPLGVIDHHQHGLGSSNVVKPVDHQPSDSLTLIFQRRPSELRLLEKVLRLKEFLWKRIS